MFKSDYKLINVMLCKKRPIGLGLLAVGFVLAVSNFFFYTEKNVDITCLKQSDQKVAAVNKTDILFIYSGRWKFLRIQLAYVYQELRRNGGILDEVWFMMIMYDIKTPNMLNEFTRTANSLPKREIFGMQFLGLTQVKPPSNKEDFYAQPYFKIFTHLIVYPNHPSSNLIIQCTSIREHFIYSKKKGFLLFLALFQHHWIKLEVQLYPPEKWCL